MRKRLSELNDWKLVNSDQDIRGHKMISADGDTIGEVDDLIVNTRSKLVETIVLADGTEYGAEDIEVDDKKAYLKGTYEGGDPTGDEADRVVRVYDDVRVQGSDVQGSDNAIPAFAEYDDDFRTHYRSTYDEDDYATYEPAYRYGYRYGTSEDYRGREYGDLEPEMRRSYEERHGEGTWKKTKGAVRHAFDRGRTHHEAGVKGPSGSERTASGDPGSAVRGQ